VAVSILQIISELGIKSAIVSNTPWGSAAAAWRKELARLGLADAVDAAVFCTDVGWRKPASPAFERALTLLGGQADDSGVTRIARLTDLLPLLE
jgi:FMN phosphatase YigB (HAD superfamily)